MWRNKTNNNIPIVLEILRDEVRGDITSAVKKLAPDYQMTWVYQGRESLFPKTGSNLAGELQEAYMIKGRQYDIQHIAAAGQVVMVELVESYPDPNTGKIYRTPLVLVLELANGKIHCGRHYCDPRLSYLDLTATDIDRLYSGRQPEITIN